MRLFTGIAPAPNVIDKLSAALSELRPTAKVKWSPLENLHITCRFIGEWPDNRLPDLASALARLAGPAPFRVRIARFGFFPHPHRPHTLFAGVHSGPELAQLADAIDRALTESGCPAENRLYQPHLTLARLQPTHDIRALRERVEGMSDTEFGSFDVTDFHLYLSRPAAHGSVYTRLATYDLMREKSAIS